MVEQWTENSCVAGSSPAYGTNQELLYGVIMSLEKWEEVIIDSTNEQYALAMIIKFRAYRKRYKGVDLDSVAEEFSTLSINEKRDWAMRSNNEQSIVAICRVQRKIKRNVMWEQMDRERKNSQYD